jgi:hypothetical protein
MGTYRGTPQRTFPDRLNIAGDCALTGYYSAPQDSLCDDPVLTLADRSDEFEDAILACFPSTGVVLAIESEQNRLALSACHLCIEHSRVVRTAFSIDAPNSACGVLRLQYEALLRASWLHFSATPAQVEKLGRELAPEAELAAKNLPSAGEMLTKVLAAAPAGLTAHLVEFNEYSRHALNSYVHSGIHPLRRVREGFPVEMALNLIRISNGLMHMAYRMLAILMESQRRMDRVTHLYKQFTDCCPMAPSGQAPGKS